MTLTRKAKVRVKAEAKGKEEGVRTEIRTKIRIRTTTISQKVLPQLPIEPDAIPAHREELGTVMSGVRGVLIRSPDPHLRGDLAHRKVRPQVRILLLQLVRSPRKLSVREALGAKAHQVKIRRHLVISLLRVSVKTETNVNFGILTCVEILPQDVLVSLESSVFTATLVF